MNEPECEPVAEKHGLVPTLARESLPVFCSSGTASRTEKSWSSVMDLIKQWVESQLEFLS